MVTFNGFTPGQVNATEIQNKSGVSGESLGLVFHVCSGKRGQAAA